MFRLINGDAFDVLKTLEPQSIDCCFTSPDPPSDIARLVSFFTNLKRVLSDRGSLWVQMGDRHEDGQMAMIPELFALSMKKNWVLRSKLIWHRPDKSKQEDMTRFKRDWEYLFFFTKARAGYYFNHLYDTSVFNFPFVYPRPGVFESGFPLELVEVALKSTCPPNSVVLDPFMDSGTTGIVALKEGHSFVGIEICPEKMLKIKKRFKDLT